MKRGEKTGGRNDHLAPTIGSSLSKTRSRRTFRKTGEELMTTDERKKRQGKEKKKKANHLFDFDSATARERGKHETMEQDTGKAN